MERRFLLDLAFGESSAVAARINRLRVGSQVRVSYSGLQASEMDRGRLFTGSLVAVSVTERRGRSALADPIREVDFRNFGYPPCDGPSAKFGGGRHRYGAPITTRRN